MMNENPPRVSDKFNLPGGIKKSLNFEFVICVDHVLEWINKINSVTCFIYMVPIGAVAGLPNLY